MSRPYHHTALFGIQTHGSPLQRPTHLYGSFSSRNTPGAGASPHGRTMASLRRSKALSPDGQTARFLYTILKQLDMKTVDWNLVADGLDITNGHAARMRFSRFKQHMEGIPTQPRTPRLKKDGGKDKMAKPKGLKRGLEDDIKGENVTGGAGEGDEARLKSEPGCHIKEEPRLIEEDQGVEGPPAVRVKREPGTERIASQANPPPDHLTQPPQSQEMVPALTLAFPYPTGAMNLAKAPIMSAPPMDTVSLADLHLSPASIPHVARFDKAAAKFDFPATPTAQQVHGNIGVTGVKLEPDLVDCPTKAAGGQSLVKSEPVYP
jgi:hypothetical protein